MHPDLAKAPAERITALKGANPNGGPIPIDLITASGSGLDPHISPAAECQVERVAAVRNLPVTKVRELIIRHTNGPQLGFLGNPTVNVLLLNQDLDR